MKVSRSWVGRLPPAVDRPRADRAPRRPPAISRESGASLAPSLTASCVDGPPSSINAEWKPSAASRAPSVEASIGSGRRRPASRSCRPGRAPTAVRRADCGLSRGTPPSMRMRGPTCMAASRSGVATNALECTMRARPAAKESTPQSTFGRSGTTTFPAAMRRPERAAVLVEEAAVHRGDGVGGAAKDVTRACAGRWPLRHDDGEPEELQVEAVELERRRRGRHGARGAGFELLPGRWEAERRRRARRRASRTAAPRRRRPPPRSPAATEIACRGQCYARSSVRHVPSTSTYEGGCHCGTVRFRVTADLSTATECNCSDLHEEGLHPPDCAARRFRADGRPRRAGDLSVQHPDSPSTHVPRRTCGIHPFYVPRSDSRQDRRQRPLSH